MAADDLVASLLLVHGLHRTTSSAVSDALDTVRPYLGSHGGDVSLIEVAGDVVRLQFTGSCKSCVRRRSRWNWRSRTRYGPPPEIEIDQWLPQNRQSSSGMIPAER